MYACARKIEVSRGPGIYSREDEYTNNLQRTGGDYNS